MRRVQDFATELAEQLRPYLAIGLEPKDIRWVIVEAMQREMGAAAPTADAPEGPPTGAEDGSIDPW
jgi:hypothetical protein